MDNSPWMPPGAPPDDATTNGHADSTSHWGVAPQGSVQAASNGSSSAAMPPPPPPAVAQPVAAVPPAPVLPPATPPSPPAPSPWSAVGQTAETPSAPTLPASAPPAPVSPALVSAPPAQWGGIPAPAAVDPNDVPIAEPPVAPGSAGRSRRSKVIVGSAVAAVIAVGAAGVFAVRSFSDGATGGAADPQELGEAFMTALENEDVLGMMDLLSPGERDVLRQPAIDLVGELTRLEVLSADADLAAIAGVDVVVEDRSVTVRSTNVDDIVNVQITAETEVTIDGEAIPVGDLVTDYMGDDLVDELRGTRETTSEPLDVEIAAVRDGDRWYFSLLHTAAEQLRLDMEPVPDIPLTGVGAVGAPSPEAAVEQMLDAAEQLDLERLIQTLNPGEAAALQRYAPLFLPAAQAELDEAPVQFEITAPEIRVEGDGAQRTAFIDAITVEGSADGESFSMSLRDGCVRVEGGGETFEQCADEVASQLDDALADFPAAREFLTALQESLADMEDVGIELRETDGAWYVSPVSTYSEATLAVLRALDRGEIERLVELGQAAFGEIMGGLFGGFDDDFTIDDGFTIDDDFTIDDFTGDDFTGDDVTSDDVVISDGTGSLADPGLDTVEAAGWEACYEVREADAAAACFDGYVQSGEIDEYYLPIELRFPECGFGARWTGELHTMSDAEFIAAIESAAPCFEALVASGTISEFELPTEVVNLACFEGRNWYNTFDDPDYDARYWECVDALFAE